MDWLLNEKLNLVSEDNRVCRRCPHQAVVSEMLQTLFAPSVLSSCFLCVVFSSEFF